MAGPLAPVGLDDLRCRFGAAQHPFTPSLAAAKATLEQTGALTIVALGSSTTAGSGASADDRSYPAVLQAELRRRLPGREITVLNKGIGGQSAYDMLMRIEPDVIDVKPAVVIWQAAVNDAIRDAGEEKLAKILRKGIAKVQQAGIEMVMMDMQWLPRESRYPRYDDYRAVLVKTAAETGVSLFPRYTMMRDWARSKAFATDEIVGMDGLQMVEASYRCLALRLADGLVSALTGLPPDTAKVVN